MQQKRWRCQGWAKLGRHWQRVGFACYITASTREGARREFIRHRYLKAPATRITAHPVIT